MSKIAIDKKFYEELLKNYININKSLLIREGNTVSTLSVNKNIMARCVVEENFPSQAAIYDLSYLIGAILISEDPVLDFTKENCMTIRDKGSRSKSTIYYADPEIIVAPPEKDHELPEEDVSFNLTWQTFLKLKKSSEIYNIPDLCLYGNDGQLVICTTDKKNDTANSFAVELQETDFDGCFCFKMENLKLFPSDYRVSIHGGQVALFESTTNRKGIQSIRYWIALEPK